MTSMLMLFLIVTAATSGPSGGSEEMKQLAFLAGEWRGQGKVHLSGGDLRPFSILESAGFTLDGAVLRIEGVATAVIDGQPRVVGKGLGLVHYDGRARVYRMHHYEASGATFETVLEVGDGSIKYEATDSDGLRLRIDIRVEPGGRWTERVDRFDAKGGWQLFREYDLQRDQQRPRPRSPLSRS